MMSNFLRICLELMARMKWFEVHTCVYFTIRYWETMHKFKSLGINNELGLKQICK